MRFLNRSTLCGAAVCLAPLVAPAPSFGIGFGVDLGDRVRLRRSQVKSHVYGERVHESGWIVGTVVFVDGESLHLDLADNSDTVSIPRNSINSIERSLGLGSRKSEGQFVGLVAGAVVGAGLGVAIAYSPEIIESGSCEPQSFGDPGCAGGAVVLGAIGLVLGGWGGSQLGRNVGGGMEKEEWEQIRWWNGKLGLHIGSPVPGSTVGASLAFRF